MTEHSGLKRHDYYEGPQALGNLWTLTRAPATLCCALSTHSLGWELRLASGANLLRSQVCKTEDEVFSTSTAWEVEARAKGWG